MKISITYYIILLHYRLFWVQKGNTLFLGELFSLKVSHLLEKMVKPPTQCIYAPVKNSNAVYFSGFLFALVLNIKALTNVKMQKNLG